MDHMGSFAVLLLLATGTIATSELWGTDDERHAIIQEAISEAKLSAQLKEELANTQEKDGSKQPTSALLLLKGFKKASPQAVSQGKARLLMEDMVHRAERKLSELKRKGKVAASAEEKAEGLSEELFHTPGKLLKDNEIAHLFKESGCSRHIPTCNQIAQRIYRTIDGTCNNLQQPLQGAAQTPFQRLIPGLYEDGIEAPRGRMQAQSTTGGSSSGIMKVGPFDPPIPSARLISQSVVRDREVDELPFTHILMQWGQFLDHDMDLSPELEETCETCDITETCDPIRIPGGDPVFGDGRGNTGDRQCLSFRRSIPSCSNDTLGSFSPREQLNDLTSYIDGSQIYGSDDETSMRLRGINGLLKVGAGNNLPPPQDPCLMMQEQCFEAGDVRVNEQVGLVTMHTLWLREHNRIATQLRTMNPIWTSERIFQEARKLVGAMLQKITYEDYLTRVLGQTTYDIVMRRYKGYNPAVDASIPNSFATAAYRYGHSLIQPVWPRFLSDQYENGVDNPLNLRSSFFNHTAFIETGIDPVLRGLVTQNSRRMDEFVNTVLTQQLFQMNDGPGMDLASLNIQRGRDHGLVPYTIWRNFCQREFPDLEMADIENQLTFIRFLHNYGALENVDLWVGGLAEERLPSSLLGPTFACIFGLTFSNARDGDRFYYENPGVFTEAQSKEIAKASLSRVICDNTDIRSIQPDAFLTNQRRVNCNTLPSVNLEVWKENDCFIKISLSASPNPFIRVYYYVNGALKTNQGHQRLRKNQPLCVPIQCPTVSTSESIHILPSYWYRSCGVHANPNMPADQYPSLTYRYYSNQLSSSLIDANSGIYSTMDGCTSGAASAVEYNCAPHIQEDEKHEDEKDEDCSSPSSTNCDLPEDIIEELDQKMSVASAISHPNPSDISKVDNTISDKDLLHQLEATLEELD